MIKFDENKEKPQNLFLQKVVFIYEIRIKILILRIYYVFHKGAFVIKLNLS